MTVNFDDSSRVPNRKVPRRILKGSAYTALSRGTKRDAIRVLNFDKDLIIHNEEALVEMQRLRKDSPFVFEHPLEQLKGKKICLNNIRGWQAHITHFLSDKRFTEYSSVLCFTETIIGGSTLNDISEYKPGWKSIHHPTAPHGLAICYQESNVVIHSSYVPTRLFSSNLELMSVLMSIDGEQVLIVLLYRPPVTTQQQIRYFIEELTDQLAELQIGQYNTIVLGDFNLDQMHDPYVQMLHGISMQFSLTQRSNYSTHIHGGILDLVLHNRKQESVEWIPTPYSDHFVLIIDI